MQKILLKLMSPVAEPLRKVIAKPSPSMTTIVGMVTLVPAGLLLTHLTSISADSHFWIAEGVLALDPLRLALAGYLVLFWAACTQMLIVSAHAFGKFHF